MSLNTIGIRQKRNKREAKLKFEALYLLDNLATVNVRDIGPTKNAIKILIFPDQRLFQCPSAKEKRQWLEMVEESKKSYLAFKLGIQSALVR